MAGNKTMKPHNELIRYSMHCREAITVTMKVPIRI